MSKTIEILRFLKTSPEGKKLMRIRGELYGSVDEIADERVQRVIRKTIADLVEMAGGLEQMIEEGHLKGIAPAEISLPPFSEDKSEIDSVDDLAEAIEISSAVNVPRPVNPSIRSTAENSQLSAEESASDEQKAFLEALRNQSLQAAESEPAKPDGGLLGRLRGLSNRPTIESDELLPKLDIGSQINTILQNKITKMPTFSGRHIELRSKFGGMLEFVVDGKSYDAVEEIPDDGVKELLQSAIADWNQS